MAMTPEEFEKLPVAMLRGDGDVPVKVRVHQWHDGVAWTLESLDKMAMPWPYSHVYQHDDKLVEALTPKKGEGSIDKRDRERFWKAAKPYQG